MKDDKKKLIIIAGPTAIGKSAAAVRLAREIGGEVISADSMQAYRGMDIGTAKITKEEADKVPHHLIDILDPDEDFSAADFKALAENACSLIYANGHIPIVCGGTGFYIQGLLYDIDFTEEPDKDEEYRARLQNILDEKKEEGVRVLAQMLKELDPLTAKHIDLKNTRRVIRALEYYRIHGSSIYSHNIEEEKKKENSPFDYRFFVLFGDRKALYERIDRRVDKMIKDGLMDEVKALRTGGIRQNSSAAQAIGYKELFACLDGKCTMEEAIETIKINSRHYAKRQLTWFKREKNTIWINIDKGDPLDEIRKYI